jgi:hypothetical protein
VPFKWVNLHRYITDLRKNDGRSKSRVLIFANRIKTVNFIGDILKRHGGGGCTSRMQSTHSA